MYLCNIAYIMSFIYGIAITMALSLLSLLPLTPVTTSMNSHLTLSQVKVKTGHYLGMRL